MRKYLNIFKSNLFQILAYKWNVLGKFLVQLIPLISSIFIWLAIYQSGGGNVDYTKNEVVLYLILTTIIATIFSPLPIFRLSSLIRSGKLSIQLIRPISILKESFSSTLGRQLINIVTVLIILLIMTITKQIEVINLFIGLLIMHFAYIMYFLMTSCISLLGFWLIQMWPLRSIYNAIYLFFGGLVFPISFLGTSVSNVFKYNPFSLIGFSITETIMGKASESQIGLYLVAMFLWCLLFIIIYIIGWKKGLKKYEGMGA